MSKSILVLDDEQECVVTLKELLGGLGYQVFVTLSPKHALEIIEREKPGLVLFDYKMPEMDGDRFFEKAKVLEPSARYILITAYRDDATVEKFKKMGVQDVMIKPIDLNKLLDLAKALR